MANLTIFFWGGMDIFSGKNVKFFIFLFHGPKLLSKGPSLPVIPNVRIGVKGRPNTS